MRLSYCHLGIEPRFRLTYTSTDTITQIYVGWVVVAWGFSPRPPPPPPAPVPVIAEIVPTPATPKRKQRRSRHAPRP
jgi:hypothetical protein